MRNAPNIQLTWEEEDELSKTAVFSKGDNDRKRFAKEINQGQACSTNNSKNVSWTYWNKRLPIVTSLYRHKGFS